MSAQSGKHNPWQPGPSEKNRMTLLNARELFSKQGGSIRIICLFCIYFSPWRGSTDTSSNSDKPQRMSIKLEPNPCRTPQRSAPGL